MSEANFSPNFFRRESNGMVKLRLNLRPEEASLLEEAAGETPVMLYLHKALATQAKRDVREARRKRTKVPPPPDN